MCLASPQATRHGPHSRWSQGRTEHTESLIVEAYSDDACVYVPCHILKPVHQVLKVPALLMGPLTVTFPVRVLSCSSDLAMSPSSVIGCSFCDSMADGILASRVILRELNILVGMSCLS